MPATTGNDTITASILTTDLDGLAGDDLLVLNYTNWLNGIRLDVIEISLLENWQSHLLWEASHFPNQVFGHAWFTIAGFERLDYTGAPMVLNRVIGGVGSDTIRGGDLGNSLNGRTGGDHIYGGLQGDWIEVTAGQGQDYLYGGDGNDRFSGVQRSDIVDGGAGNDTLTFDLTGETAVNTTLTALTSNPNWTGIEVFVGTLTAGNDILRVTDIPGELYGGAGDDLIVIDRRGLTALDKTLVQRTTERFEHVYFLGSEENDRIIATWRDDTVFGYGGDDLIWSGAGHDLLVGGAGNDTFSAVQTDDTIHGGAGIDTVYIDLSNATERVVVGQGRSFGNTTGIEVVAGTLTPFDDVMVGGAMTTSIDAGAGTDLLYLDYTTHPLVADVEMRLADPAIQLILLSGMLMACLLYTSPSPRD